MDIAEKYKDILIAVGFGAFLSLQATTSVPGITDQGVAMGNHIKFIGIGSALGFFVGLANLSKANPNPHKVAGFIAFFMAGIAALLANLYRGYIASDFGFNIASLVSVAFVPMMLVGGAASAAFSKNA